MIPCLSFCHGCKEPGTGSSVWNCQSYKLAGIRELRQCGQWTSQWRDTHRSRGKECVRKKLPEEFSGKDRESENLMPSSENEEKRITEQERRNAQSEERQPHAGLRIQGNHEGSIFQQEPGQNSENSAFLIRKEHELFSALALQLIRHGGREGRGDGGARSGSSPPALGPWAWLGRNPLGPGTQGTLALNVLPQGL